MDSKARNDLLVLLRGVFIVGGLYLIYNYIDNTPVYLYFIVIIVGAVLPDIIIPVKKKKTKTTNNPKNKSSIKKLRNPTDQQLLTAKFEELEGVDFERLVAMYYKDLGYNPVIIGGSGDHEVDLILTDPKEKYKIAVQCKCWNK